MEGLRERRNKPDEARRLELKRIRTCGTRGKKRARNAHESHNKLAGQTSTDLRNLSKMILQTGTDVLLRSNFILQASTDLHNRRARTCASSRSRYSSG